MYLETEERLKENDKVLAIVTNQYMFEQLLWYQSKYPEGVWDALIIKFGRNNEALMEIMHKKCVECGFFDKIVHYDYKVSEKSLFVQAFRMFGYIFQYVTQKRKKNDERLIQNLMGECNYKKIIIHSTVGSNVPMAALNAMPDRVLVCLEDGLGDYLPAGNIQRWSELPSYMLAKMDVMNGVVNGHQFQLKHDKDLIKYCSLPDKMRYRNYKVIKQLFENDNREVNFSERELSLSREGYEMIIFSTCFSDFKDGERACDTLYTWLKENHSGKKIFIKPHPRDESCQFEWDDLDICVGGEDMTGERLLELMPDAEVLFLFTSTILLKACRSKRNFKVVRFENIELEWYRMALKNDSQLLGLTDRDWIVLGEK